MVAAADAERHVRRVIAHESQHIQVAGSGETGSGVQTSEERPGRQHAVGIVEERDGGVSTIFHEVLGRADNRSDDIRQAAAIIEDRGVIGGRRPLAHEQPVGGERVGDLVKIGVVERTVARGEVGSELRPRESTGRKLGFERGELHRVRRRGRDIGRRLQDERRVVEQRIVGPDRDIQHRGKRGVAGVVRREGVNVVGAGRRGRIGERPGRPGPVQTAARDRHSVGKIRHGIDRAVGILRGRGEGDGAAKRHGSRRGRNAERGRGTGGRREVEITDARGDRVAGIVAGDGLHFITPGGQTGKARGNPPEVGELLADAEAEAVAIKKELDRLDEAVAVGRGGYQRNRRGGGGRAGKIGERDHRQITRGVVQLNRAGRRTGRRNGAAGEGGRQADRIGIGHGVGEDTAIRRGGADPRGGDRRNVPAARASDRELDGGRQRLVGQRDRGGEIGRSADGGDGRIVGRKIERHDRRSGGGHGERDHGRNARVARVIGDRGKESERAGRSRREIERCNPAVDGIELRGTRWHSVGVELDRGDITVRVGREREELEGVALRDRRAAESLDLDRRRSARRGVHGEVDEARLRLDAAVVAGDDEELHRISAGAVGRDRGEIESAEVVNEPVEIRGRDLARAGAEPGGVDAVGEEKLHGGDVQ